MFITSSYRMAFPLEQRNEGLGSDQRYYSVLQWSVLAPERASSALTLGRTSPVRKPALLLVNKTSQYGCGEPVRPQNFFCEDILPSEDEIRAGWSVLALADRVHRTEL